MSFDEEKYQSLRNTLKSTARVKAKDNFEARLLQRIKEAENQPLQTEAFNKHPQVVNLTKPKSRFAEILAGLFKPSLTPALGLTAVLLIAVVVYFGYFNKTGEMTSENTKVSASDEKHDGFVIYVKKDEDYSKNYPKEISSIDGETKTSSSDMRTISPTTETPSDFYVQPGKDESSPVESLDKQPEMKTDRVSEEQRIEMERDSKLGREDIESKGYRKDDVMKKESKTEKKMEPKKSPYNIRDEKSNENINSQNDGVIKQEQNQPVYKAEENDDEKTTQKDNSESSRISRAKSDSLKSKDTNKVDDSIQQK